MDKHTCHAENCNEAIPPRLFMCRKHWLMLPNLYRTAINRNYRPGQEIDKHPSTIYIRMAKDAIKVVADIEALLKADPQTLFDGTDLGVFDVRLRPGG